LWDIRVREIVIWNSWSSSCDNTDVTTTAAATAATVQNPQQRANEMQWCSTYYCKQAHFQVEFVLQSFCLQSLHSLSQILNFLTKDITVTRQALRDAP